MARQETEIKVGGMSCQHCVKSIERALGQLAGVDRVRVDLAQGKVLVVYQAEGVSVETIKNAIAKQGYDVE